MDTNQHYLAIAGGLVDFLRKREHGKPARLFHKQRHMPAIFGTAASAASNSAIMRRDDREGVIAFPANMPCASGVHFS